MTEELPSAPRKIGDHFTFYGLHIQEAGGKTNASVEYSYKGNLRTSRIRCSGSYIHEKLLKKLLMPIREKRLCTVKGNPGRGSEEVFIVKKDGHKFFVGTTDDIPYDDRILVTSKDGAPIDNLMGFLSYFETSMSEYKEEAQ